LFLATTDRNFRVRFGIISQEYMSTKAVGSLWSKFFLLRYSPRHYDKAGVFRSVTLRVVSNPPGPVRCAPLCITGAGGVYPFLLVAGSTVNLSPPIRHTLLRRNLPANSFLRATTVRVGPAPQTPDFLRRVFTPTCTHVCLRNALKIFHFFVRTIIPSPVIYYMYMSSCMDLYTNGRSGTRERDARGVHVWNRNKQRQSLPIRDVTFICIF